MKPLYLRLQAFGPFPESVAIDFDRTFDGGLFLIHGPTGSGKTSLLDGLCFSLFGRPSTAERERDLRALRSDLARNETLTETEFIFGLGDRAYRVFRRPTQVTPKKRGEGFTEHKATAELYRWRNSIPDLRKTVGRVVASNPRMNTRPEWLPTDWEPLAGKADAVDTTVQSLIGMDERQFRQVVVLPQGRFREFLSSSSADRQQILERLFQTDRFSRFQQWISQRAKAAKEQWQLASQSIQARLEGAGISAASEIPIRAKEAQENVERYHADEQQISKRVRGLQQEAEIARRRDGLLIEAESIKVKLAQLEAQAPAIESSRARYRLAIQLKNYFVLCDQERDLKLKAERLGSTQKEAIAHATSKESLLQIQMQKKDSLLARTPGLAELQNQRLQLREAYAQFKNLERIDLLLRDADSAALAESSALSRLNQDAASLQEAKKALIQRGLACHEALGTKENQTLAEIEKRLQVAELQYHQSEAHRLAALLKPNSPCPVCGSKDHPLPATSAKGNTESVSLEKVNVLREQHKQAQVETTKLQESRRNLLEPLLTLLNVTKTKPLGSADMSWPALVKELDHSESELDRTTRAAAVAAARAQTQKEQVSKLQAERAHTLEALAQDKLAAIYKSLKAVNDRGVEISREVELREKEERALSESIQTLSGELSRLRGQIAAQGEELRQVELDLTQNAKSLANEQREHARDIVDFAPDIVQTYRLEANALVRLEQTLKSHDSALAIARSDREANLEKLKSLISTRETSLVFGELAAVEAQHAQSRETLTRERFRLEQLQGLESDVAASFEKMNALEATALRAEKMSQLLSGDRTQNKLAVPLARFVLQSRFEAVLDQANRRLSRMSRGQYQLRRPALSRNLTHAQGLNLSVEDANTGKERHADSLSGGESFMAALALALGLADVVQADLGGVRLDSVLIDEGFGTLDSEALELALRTLIDLQAGGRVVGVISHVQELKAAIHNRIEVRKSSAGGSIRWASPEHGITNETPLSM